jgi:hypothetical protein
LRLRRPLRRLRGSASTVHVPIRPADVRDLDPYKPVMLIARFHRALTRR